VKKLIALLFVAGVGFLIFKFGGALFRKLDRTKPQISLKSEILGLGSGNASAEFSVKDEGAGIAKVSILAQQNEKTIELFQQEIPEANNELNFNSPISVHDKGFIEGPIKLTFTAVDNSFFHNEESVSKDLLLDYAKPQVQILTQQFRAKEAGAEFVMFRAKDSNLKATGVSVGKILFPAVKASELDSAFANEPDIYGALFAIPFASSGGDRHINIYADDMAGNQTLVAMTFLIDTYKQAEASPKITEKFVNEKIEELLPGYERRSGKKAELNRSNEEGLAKAFKLINEEYRGVLEKILQEKMTKNAPGKFLWREIFIKPMPSATSSTLGEKRHYFLNNVDAGNSVHAGLDLASVENDAVHAANDGTVVMAEEFGIYGNAILIDHGFGVFSLYGHLSSIGKNVNDKVSKGDEIGRSGRTGLAGGDHLHFEIRINGIPVSPIEWWDQKWMQDDFYGKLAGVKTNLLASKINN